ncbi:MAG: hypothetical protein AAFU86_01090 [Pseudomonadota bacterium]
MAQNVEPQEATFHAADNAVNTLPWRYLASSDHLVDMLDEDGEIVRPLTFGVDFAVLPEGDVPASTGAITQLTETRTGEVTMRVRHRTPPINPLVSTPGAEGIVQQLDRVAIILAQLNRDIGALGTVSLPGIIQPADRPGERTIEYFGGGIGQTDTQNALAGDTGVQALENEFGGGKLIFGPGTYNLGASSQGGFFEAGGRKFAASRYALVVPSGKVSLIGNKTRLRMSEQGLGGIMPCSPDGMQISGFQMDGADSALNASGNSGLYTVTPSASDRTNLLTGTVADVDLTASFGGFTSTDASLVLSNNGTRLRATFDGGYAGPHHVSSAGFAAIAGQEIKISVRAYSGTLISADRLSASIAADAVNPASRVAGTTTTVRPNGNYRFDYTVTIPADGTYYLHLHGNANNNGTEADYAGTFFEIDEVKLALFPLLDQRLWCRDFLVSDMNIHGFSSYIVGLQGDHDFINTVIQRLRGTDCGADMFDTKNRGPSMMAEGLSLFDIYAARFGLRVAGQAGIDLHAPANVCRVFMEDYGKDDDTVTAIRCRTLADPDIPYEGEAARGSNISEFTLIGNGRGDCVAVSTGSADVRIENGRGKNHARGVVYGGNSFGGSDRGGVGHVTMENCSDKAFQIAGDRVTVHDCNALAGPDTDGDSIAYDVSGDDCSLRDNFQTGIANPLAYTGNRLAIRGGNIMQDVPWTPVYSDGVNDAVSYALQEGRWSWNGRFVEISGVIEVTDIGSVSGPIRITGLPHPATSVPDVDYSLPASSFANMNFGGIGRSPLPVVQHGQDFITIQVEDTVGGTTAVDQTQFPAGGRIAFSGRYRVD